MYEDRTKYSGIDVQSMQLKCRVSKKNKNRRVKLEVQFRDIAIAE
jgi:hypothetical protein